MGVICNDLDDEQLSQFEQWRIENAELLSNPTILSLLYDLNRLPEVVLTFKSGKMMRDLVLIVEHFKRFRAPTPLPDVPAVSGVRE